MRRAVVVLITGAIAACTMQPSPHSSSGTARPDDLMVAIAPALASSESPAAWLRNSPGGGELTAYGWDGVARGSITVRSNQPWGFFQSPDGTRLLLQDALGVDGAKVVRRLPVGGYGERFMWADDSSGLCFEIGRGPAPSFTQGSPTPGELSFVTAGGSSRFLASYGTYFSQGQPQILSCGASRGWVLAAQESIAHQADQTLLRMRDGAVLFRRSSLDRAGRWGRALSSPDGSLLAVGWSWRPGEDYAFDVRGLPSGSTLAGVPGEPVTFSSDGSRVLSVTWIGNGNTAGVYRLVDWRTGGVLWTAPGRLAGLLARPGSGDLLLEIGNLGSTSTDPAARLGTTLLLLGADGNAKTFGPPGLETPWPIGGALAQPAD